jgi:hypothetical protein
VHYYRRYWGQVCLCDAKMQRKEFARQEFGVVVIYSVMLSQGPSQHSPARVSASPRICRGWGLALFFQRGMSPDSDISQ